jgi:hypothetical protein
LAPLIASGIIAIAFSSGFPRHPSQSPASDACEVAASILLSSTIASIVGLLGLIKHSSRNLLWKSVAGLILSFLFFGVLLFIGTLFVLSGG